MLLTRSQAAAAVKATRSSAPLDAHSAAWSGGSDPPKQPDADRDDISTVVCCLLEDILVVFELGPDQRTWTWSRQHRCRSGREETSAEPRRKVKWLSEWVNWDSLLLACVLWRCSCMTIVSTCAEEEFHPTGDPDFPLALEFTPACGFGCSFLWSGFSGFLFFVFLFCFFTVEIIS